jgi:periplasmic copper chaperone A
VKKLIALVSFAAVVLPAAAFAHANVSPPVALAKVSQVYTLAVPTEKDNASTTRVELTPPTGFSIDSFVPSPGWTREVQQTGSGEDAVITRVTWSGAQVPTGEDAAFSFLGRPSTAGIYTFKVRQTYSDGSVVDWSGDESSDTPAPTLDARSSLGGGGGSDTLAIVALVVGAVGIVLGGIALLAGGRRALA